MPESAGVLVQPPTHPMRRIAPSFEALSLEQRAIVEHLDGAVLALAPAGTGKTTVLTERVARALAAGIPPERILCVTFTNRAARELRTRLVSRFPGMAAKLAPRTFHQLCADILRQEAKRVGLPVEFAVCPDHDSISMLKRILASPDNDDREATAIYRKLQDVKAHWPTNALAWPIGQAWARAGFELPRQWQAAQKYERALSQWQRIDFSDLVLYVRGIFAANPEVRARWSSRYDLVQVDEIQDTHLSEYEVVATLAGQSRNLALFGDMDQTIYEWRGATPRDLMSRFDRDFPGVLKVSLTDNHRATRALIHAADTFANTLKQRVTSLTAAPACPAGEPVQEHVAQSVSAEAGWIAGRVATLARDHGVPLPSIGVLAPANWYCEEIAGALTRRGVPHVTAARMLFYRRPEIGDALAFLKLILNPEAPGEALRVWECSTRGIGHDVLRRIAKEGQPVGLRLVDFFQLATFTHGDPLAPLLEAFDHGQIVVFDLETTGLDEMRDEIVEVAAMRLASGRRSAAYTALVRPTIPVGESEAVHGLSDERLARDGRPPEEVIGRLLGATDGALLVGHNVSFDIRMLAAQAARLGLTFAPTASFDTLDLARRFHNQEPYTLEALSVGLRLMHRPSHRAADDVATTVDLLAWAVGKARAGAATRRTLVAECGTEFEALARRLDGWREILPTTRPADLLERVLEESGLNERVAQEPARRQALAELLRTFRDEDDTEQAPVAALRAALERAALATQVDLLATAEQRVPVLTIHQAKGLEFDIVFVAGCSDGDLPRRRSMLDHRDEEERRLFYVALTRARKQLILSRAAYSDGGRAKPPSPFLKALGDTLVPAPP